MTKNVRFILSYDNNRRKQQIKHKNVNFRGSVTQWVACLTCNVEVVGSSPIKGPHCFREQETLPVLLSTGWVQEQIPA